MLQQLTRWHQCNLCVCMDEAEVCLLVAGHNCSWAEQSTWQSVPLGHAVEKINAVLSCSTPIVIETAINPTRKTALRHSLPC